MKSPSHPLPRHFPISVQIERLVGILGTNPLGSVERTRPVYGARTGKDKTIQRSFQFFAGSKQIGGSKQIDFQSAHRVIPAIGGLQGSKVKHPVGLNLFHHLRNRFGIGKITRPVPVVVGRRILRRRTIETEYFRPFVQQNTDRMTSDTTRRPSDQYLIPDIPRAGLRKPNRERKENRPRP